MVRRLQPQVIIDNRLEASGENAGSIRTRNPKPYIGAWMQQNSDSIYGCGRAELPKPEWGYYTQNGKKLYAHVFEPPIGPLGLAGLGDRVKKVRLLADGSELKISQPWNTFDFADHIFVNFREPEHLTYPLPNDVDTVLMLELK